jgi:hypothetical protein
VIVPVDGISQARCRLVALNDVTHFSG